MAPPPAQFPGSGTTYAHQRRVSGRCPLAEGHGHIDVRVGVQCRIYLAEFDAMTTNLDLTVGPAPILDGEFGCPRGDVTRFDTYDPPAARAGWEQIGLP